MSEIIKDLHTAVKEKILKQPASFRDPSGFVFEQNGILYRQVNQVYREHYDHLINSGLYDVLIQRGLMVPHQEINNVKGLNDAYKILEPSHINFISYPYEWSFSQLKDAALLTLEIQRIALNHHMTLKDASAYNVQFFFSRPIFIDTLSFEKYQEGQPWAAYRQFCQHFLAPLSLMAQKNISLNKLLAVHIDGIPLDLTSSLLPRSTWFNVGLALHVHIHAKTQKAFSSTDHMNNDKTRRQMPVSKNGLIGILDGLQKTITKLKWKTTGTEWGEYYGVTNYSESAFQHKKNIVEKYIEIATPRNVWDLGGNVGVFSRIASNMNIPTVSFDIDPLAVEINYREVLEKKEKFLLPLLLDLTNPSPGLGWNCSERSSIFQRGPADCILALALIHHLSISNNVPFENLSDFFSKICKSLIVEFIPKDDSQIQRLLRSRKDIFVDYSQKNFEAAFMRHFNIKHAESISGSARRLYLMQKKEEISEKY